MTGGNWSVLGLTADPVRGEPAAVRELANACQQDARRWEEQVQALRTIANEGGAMDMEGDFAPKAREAMQSHPNEAQPLARGRTEAGTALATYAQALERAKNMSQQALRQGEQAKRNFDVAKRQYDQITAQMVAMSNTTYAYGPAYNAAVQRFNMLRQQQQRAWQAMQQADNQLRAAQRMAMDAGQQATQAENAAAQKVSAASPTAAAARSGSGGGSGGGAAAAARRPPPDWPPDHAWRPGMVTAGAPFAAGGAAAAGDASKRARLEQMKAERAERAREAEIRQGIDRVDGEMAAGTHKTRFSQEDRDWLNSDPRHKGLAYDPDVGTYRVGEARQALAAEQAGVLPGPVKRGTQPGEDFVDGTGTGWSFKGTGPHSSVESTAGLLGKEATAGRPALGDLRGLSPEDQARVREQVATQLGGRSHAEVRFIPPGIEGIPGNA